MLNRTPVLLAALVPVALIVLIKVCPAKTQPASDEPVISETKAVRIEAKERRAEREEARKEKRAIKKAQEREQRSLEDSDRWFAAHGEPSEFNENDGQFGWEEDPVVPGMMPLPMPPVLPNIAYGRMRGGRGFEGGDGFEDSGYAPDAGFDTYNANGYENTFGNGFRRF
jgi:hypothetical protein